MEILVLVGFVLNRFRWLIGNCVGLNEVGLIDFCLEQIFLLLFLSSFPFSVT